MPDGFEQGSIAAANAIFKWQRKHGFAPAAEAAFAAWNANTLVEAEPPMIDGMPKMGKTEARARGYTGDQCVACNSMKMKIDGHCQVCEDCGQTTGCS